MVRWRCLLPQHQAHLIALILGILGFSDIYFESVDYVTEGINMDDEIGTHFSSL